MNAQELTKVVNKLENQIIEIEKNVKYLNNMIDKMVVRIYDLEIEMKQLHAPAPVYLDKGVKK